MADCFSALADDLEACDSCCGACEETTAMDNSESKKCVCSVLGTRSSSYTNGFRGSNYNDCIFITGDYNDDIKASIPASEAVEERLPFPRAERGPMPPGAPKGECVRDPAS